MPTYEFLCLDHGHRFEVSQRIGEDPVTACPECGSAVRKVFHPVGVVLKGSGFYKTDSRTSKETTEPKKDAPAKPEKKSEKKTEAKKEKSA